MLTVILAVALVALAGAGVAGASSPQAVASPQSAESPQAVVSPVAATVTCAVAPLVVVYGDGVQASGAVAPGVAGQQVIVSLSGADVGTATTDASGNWSLGFVPRTSGQVVARLADGTASAPVDVKVQPKVTLSRGRVAAFLKTRFTLHVTPDTYAGLVTAEVVHRGRVVGEASARVRAGVADLNLLMKGVGQFTVKFTLPDSDGYAGATFETKVEAAGRRLSVGSSGLDVKGMLSALAALKFRVPGIGMRFTTQVRDAVMAFQKAYGLPRTYVFDTRDWRKLETAQIVRPRFKSPKTHIEVDKGRQIMIVVRGGQVAGVLCVSTGATGNTPEGAFHIQQKHPFTGSGYGGTLVRTMGFLGNFAMHGYSPVPPYPASHGCVREPIWACYWVYNVSFVGERVYIYH